MSEEKTLSVVRKFSIVAVVCCAKKNFRNWGVGKKGITFIMLKQLVACRESKIIRVCRCISL